MNNYFNNFNSFENVKSNDNHNDSKLIKKLSKQSGDNMTFNMAGYNNNSNPNQLFDIYNGFIRGNMFPDLFNLYKLSRPYDVKPLNEQAELLTKVDAYCFACHDINLYLDTHPYDKNMINLFKELSDDYSIVLKEYEKKYGPICVNDSITYPWAWNESPWPWEGN